MPGATASSSRGHHIRAVVDQFLADGWTAPLPRATASWSGARPFRFAVAAPGAGAVAAWVCARLARASLRIGAGDGGAPPRVMLEEWHQQLWSAVPFLGGTDHDHLRRLFRPLDPGGSTGVARRWVGAVEVVPPQPTESPPNASGSFGICWLNFGRLSPEAIEAVEALPAWDGGAARAGGVDGLVWCRGEEDGGALRDAYWLGRLIAATGARQVRLVRVCATARRPDTALAREASLAASVAPDLQVEALPLLVADLVADTGADDPLARLAAGMTMAAAAARRRPGEAARA